MQCARNECRRRIPDLLAIKCRVGIVVDQLWYCSVRCVERTVGRHIRGLPPAEPAFVQSWRPMKLGALLVRQVGLSPDRVEAVLAKHAKRAPVGAVLREAGLVSAEDVLRALATQAGVRYLTSVDPRVVRQRRGDLPSDVVRALGIVPVAANPDRREMQVACVAPVPGLAVRALTRVSGWAVEPLLVADEALPTLVEVYAASTGQNDLTGPSVCDPDAGLARVARLARRWRAVRLLYERCDPYVWIRLDNGESTADLLMALPTLKESY